MSEYTPAPWNLETVKTQVGVCHKIGKLGSTTKLNYACLYDDCYSDKARDLQLLADAHLIASAPELLEALKAWEHWYGTDSTELNRDTAREIGLKAIAKAEAR